MLTDPASPSGTESDAPADGRPARRRWQVGLRTLFLLMGVAAAWMAAYVNRRDCAFLGRRIAAMRPLAHELAVDDPARIAVVLLDPKWGDDNRWDLYLPPGSYRICLATRDVPEKGLPAAMKSAPIEAGRHRLALDQQAGDAFRVSLSCDGRWLMRIEEPKGFPGDASSGGGLHPLSTQLAANRPAIFYERRYLNMTVVGGSAPTRGPADGLMLWIEPVPGPKPAR